MVDVFKPEVGGGEQYVAQLTGPEPGVQFSKPTGVAVNQSNDEVLISDGLGSTGEHVYIFKPATITGQYESAGELSGPLPGGTFGEIMSLAVDGGSGVGGGDIYVAEGTSPSFVDQFNDKGELVGRLTGTPNGPFHDVQSVTVDPVSHDVYAADYTGVEGKYLVDAFGPDIVLPEVVTEEPSNLTPSSVTLNGKINPESEGEVSCRFVWGTSTDFGHSAACEPEKVANGASQIMVHATLNEPFPA